MNDLKLIREALESCVDGDYSTGNVIHPSFDSDAVNKALAALDRIEKQKPFAWHHPEEGLSYSDHYTGNVPLFLTPPAAPAVLQDEFREGQWWVLELDAAVADGTPDQKRAVAVVHNLLRQISTASAVSDDKEERLLKAREALGEFRRRLYAVPSFSSKVNKATREALTLAHSVILNLDTVGGPLDYPPFNAAAPKPESSE